ncbi:MAG: hypothetical protein JWN13_6719 [Betaproteobacteria bacterium]|jgi:hypothetical protein|nr:hypothetical protein [Betaproteobacteria bacterium]
MCSFRRIRISALTLFVLAVSTTSALSAQSTQSSSKAPGGDNQPVPMLMLVPVEISDPAMKSGCWAQFFDERNFKGDVITLVGPMELQVTDRGSGRQLRRKLDSLMTGPKARLTVYEHKLFKDRSVTFEPNSKEPGLIKKLGFAGRIESLKLECTQ